MAKKSQLPSGFLIIAVVIVVLLLLGTTVYALFQKQVLEQHASLTQFTTIAVKGNLYLDANNNGKKDTGEVNYTGRQLPKVKLALFSQSCPSPTTSEPSVTSVPITEKPSPTSSEQHCHYVTECPKIVCREKAPCPTCTPIRICVTPQPTQTQEKGIEATPAVSLPLVEEQSTSVKGISDTKPTGDSKTSEGNNVSVEPEATHVTDHEANTCRELPQRLYDCTVSSDGTYLCSVQNVEPFTSASISIEPPTFFKVTTQNPVIVSQAAATVDFGFLSTGILAEPSPTTDQKNSSTDQGNGQKNFTIHVDGTLPNNPVVVYISEGKENPNPEVSGVFTTDASGDITIKAIPNDQLFIIPIASKGYTSITPQRLEVTVSPNSCGISSPCLFSAQK